MRNHLRFSYFFIFLLNVFHIQTLKTNNRMTQSGSNNNTSPVFMGPAIGTDGYTSRSNGLRNPQTDTNNNNNVFMPSQPGIPAAFYPVTLGSIDDNTASQPNLGSTPMTPPIRRETPTFSADTFIPSQPGIPGAFLPQPLTGLRTIDNTAAGIIPDDFWIRQNETYYLVLKNRLHGYLSCGNDTLSIIPELNENNTSIPENILWYPEVVRTNTITLKSQDGGYLYLKNSLFYCNRTMTDLNSHFQVRIGLKNDRSRSIDFLALRIDIGYLGIRDNIVMLIQQLDERSMFDPVRSTGV